MHSTGGGSGPAARGKRMGRPKGVRTMPRTVPVRFGRKTDLATDKPWKWVVFRHHKGSSCHRGTGRRPGCAGKTAALRIYQAHNRPMSIVRRGASLGGESQACGAPVGHSFVPGAGRHGLGGCTASVDQPAQPEFETSIRLHRMDKQFLAVFSLALASGVMLRRSFPGDLVPKAVNRMAWLFLIVLAAETFSRHTPNIVYFLVGMVLLLFVTGIAFMVRGFERSESSDFLTIASTTFGGGNRGFALISVISAWSIFSDDQRKRIIEAFIQMDVMILAWLMFAVPTLLWYRNKKNQADLVDSIKSVAKDIGAPPLAVMAIVILSWAVPANLKSQVATFLEPSHAGRSAVLMYLSLTYVFMITTIGSSSVGSILRSVIIFYAPRWISAITAIFIMSIFSVRDDLAAVLIPPIIVFAVCPPSSGINNFLESFGASEKCKAEIADLNLVTTLIFVGILLVATVSGPIAVTFFRPSA